MAWLHCCDCFTWREIVVGRSQAFHSCPFVAWCFHSEWRLTGEQSRLVCYLVLHHVCLKIIGNLSSLKWTHWVRCSPNSHSDQSWLQLTERQITTGCISPENVNLFLVLCASLEYELLAEVKTTQLWMEWDSADLLCCTLAVISSWKRSITTV